LYGELLLAVFIIVLPFVGRKEEGYNSILVVTELFTQYLLKGL